MAAGLHGSARTTPRVRAELQTAQASTRALANQYGLNPKTVAKWRARPTTADAPMGPRQPRSTVLTEAEEAIIVEFRRRTLLPLDDVMGALRDAIPKLSRSALHRCLERHGISRLPRDEEATSKRKRFAETTIGYVHIDICELRLAEGKLFMFLAIDRVSKFAHVAFLPAATKMNGALFSIRSWRPIPTPSIPCSLITAWLSPTCQSTAMGLLPSGWAISSTASAASTASSISSPNPIILGPMVRPSG